jgi:hypothetical protein
MQMHLTDVRSHLLANEESSRAFLSSIEVLAEIDTWLQLLLDCHSLAVTIRREGQHHYAEAYASISTMAFSYAESARTLLLRGFYGNVLAHVRATAAFNDLLEDLAADPSSAAKWLELRFVTPADVSKEANARREYFRDHRIRERIRERGSAPLSDSIRAMASEAVHGAPWASYVFSPESLENRGEYSIEYRPQYHPFRSLLTSQGLRMTLPHLSGFFLQGLDDERRGKDHRFTELSERYFSELETYERRSRIIQTMLSRSD